MQKGNQQSRQQNRYPEYNSRNVAPQMNSGQERDYPGPKDRSELSAKSVIIYSSIS